MRLAAKRPATLLLTLLLAAAILGSNCSADDPVFSGPQPGESLMPFEVTGVYDDLAGKKFDPVEQADGKPTLIVFVHKLTRPGIALTRALAGYASSLEEAYATVVWLDEDTAEAEQWLAQRRKPLNLQAPVGVSVDGAEGPGAYGLNRNVELTILVADGKQVTANFALVQPSVTEAAKIAGELAKLVDQPAPTPEKMESYAYPGQKMRGRAMRGGRGMRREPATTAREQQIDKQLRQMLRQLVAAGRDEDQREVVAKKIEVWAKESPKRQRQLARLSTLLHERDVASAEVKEQLKEWQKQFGSESKPSDGEAEQQEGK